MMIDDSVDSIDLQPWSWQTPEGFTLRGWRSRPSGRPVLHFIHGTGMCGLTYWPLLQQLAVQVDLFISDLHGHGDSDGASPFVGWNRSAELAVAAWQAHADEYGQVPVIAGGHSLGAVISALMLGNSGGVFSRALLLDPVIMPPVLARLGRLAEISGLYRRNAMARRVRQRRRHWPSREHAQQALQQRGIFHGWSEQALDAYLDHALSHHADGSCRLKCPPSIEGDIFGSLPRGLWPALGRVNVPVELVMGTRTYPFALKAAAHWQRRNRHVRLHSVDGDHCYMQDDPQGTARLLLPLLTV